MTVPRGLPAGMGVVKPSSCAAVSAGPDLGDRSLRGRRSLSENLCRRIPDQASLDTGPPSAGHGNLLFLKGPLTARSGMPNI
jgi:hypothetical protein